jgi:hypothetical protein
MPELDPNLHASHQKHFGRASEGTMLLFRELPWRRLGCLPAIGFPGCSPQDSRLCPCPLRAESGLPESSLWFSPSYRINAKNRDEVSVAIRRDTKGLDGLALPQAQGEEPHPRQGRGRDVEVLPSHSEAGRLLAGAFRGRKSLPDTPGQEGLLRLRPQRRHGEAEAIRSRASSGHDELPSVASAVKCGQNV